MSVALNNSGSAAGTGNSISCAVDYSSTDGIIVAYVTTMNTGGTGVYVNVTGITDGAGLTWHFREKYQAIESASSRPMNMEVWWAYSSGSLTADSITAALDATPTSCGIIAASFSGCGSFTMPWDQEAVSFINKWDGSATPYVNANAGSPTRPTGMQLGFFSSSSDPVDMNAGFGATRIASQATGSGPSAGRIGAIYKSYTSERYGETTGLNDARYDTLVMVLALNDASTNPVNIYEQNFDSLVHGGHPELTDDSWSQNFTNYQTGRTGSGQEAIQADNDTNLIGRLWHPSSGDRFTRYVVGFNWRMNSAAFDNLPGDGLSWNFELRNDTDFTGGGSAGQDCLMLVNTSGEIYVWTGGTFYGPSTTNIIKPNVDAYIELVFKLHETLGYFEVYVDDVLVLSRYNLRVGSPSADILHTGTQHFGIYRPRPGTETGGSLYFDDLYIDHGLTPRGSGGGSPDSPDSPGPSPSPSPSPLPSGHSGGSPESPGGGGPSNSLVTFAAVEALTVANPHARITSAFLEVLSTVHLPIWNPGPYGPHQYVRSAPSISTNMVTTDGALPFLQDGDPGTGPYYFDDTILSNRTGWSFAYTQGPVTISGADGTSITTTGETYAPAAQGNVGCWIQWDFPTWTAIGWLMWSPGSPFTMGSWQLQGSQDGFETWDDIGKPFEPSLAHFNIGGDDGIFFAAYFPLPNYMLRDGQGDHYKTTTTSAGGRANLPGPSYRDFSTGTPLYVDTLFYKSFRLIGVSPLIIGNSPFKPRTLFNFNVMSGEYQYFVEQNPTDPLMIPPPNGKFEAPGYTDPFAPADLPPPYSNFDSIYSQGRRLAQTMSDGTDTSVYTGNGLITNVAWTFTEQFADGYSAFDNGFAFGTGNGPTFGGYAEGSYFEIQFDQPINLTTIRLYNSDDNIGGTWELQGSDDGDDATAFTTISSAQTMNPELHSGDPSNTAYVDLLVEYTFTAHLRYRIVCVTPPVSGGRFCNEMYFKVAHDPFDGGDRNGSHPNVGITSNIHASWDDGTTVHTLPTDGTGDYSMLIDGIYDHIRSAWSPQRNNLALISQPFFATGDYLQFRFPNEVTMKRMLFRMAENFPFEVLDDHGIGTHYGSWQLTGSNDGTTWEDVGHEVYFEPATNHVLLDFLNADVQFGYWKLTKTATVAGTIGSSTPGQREFVQIVFDIINSGPPIANNSALITHDTPDSFHGTGNGVGATLTWASTERKDTFNGQPPNVGNLNASEHKDTFQALGTGVAPPEPPSDRKRRIFFVT